MMNQNRILQYHDIVLITLDTLRYDVAVSQLELGNTPNLGRYISGWEKRHTPASFTFAAHQAFFAGFLPTPVEPGRHFRRFALSFPGSETTGPDTLALDAPTLMEGLRKLGYHTICIGGTGFFNQQTPLGSVLPSLFDEAHWAPELGVTCPASTENQVALALSRLDAHPEPCFLFLNVSALHQPNRFYLPGATTDTLESHAAALAYVDGALKPLLDRLEQRGAFGVICSDHGTAYGEDGYQGHRIGHSVVWTVPYAELWIGQVAR